MYRRRQLWVETDIYFYIQVCLFVNVCWVCGDNCEICAIERIGGFRARRLKVGANGAPAAKMMCGGQMWPRVQLAGRWVAARMLARAPTGDKWHLFAFACWLQRDICAASGWRKPAPQSSGPLRGYARDNIRPGAGSGRESICRHVGCAKAKGCADEEMDGPLVVGGAGWLAGCVTWLA